MNVQIRRVGSPDRAFHERMTYEAFYWDSTSQRPPLEQALQAPEVRQYFDGWGRDGDVAVVAFDPYSGRPLGMAWARKYPADNPSFGFVSPDVPEVSIAVVEQARGQRVGTRLLEALGNELRKEGITSVSGAVEDGNPAVNLYRRLGGTSNETRDGAKIMTRTFGASSGERSL